MLSAVCCGAFICTSAHTTCTQCSNAVGANAQVRSLLSLPEPPAAAPRAAPLGMPLSASVLADQAVTVGGSTASATSSSSPPQSFTLPPYPPSVSGGPLADPTALLNHHHLYPLALAMQGLSAVASASPQAPHPASPSGKPSAKPSDNDVIVIDD